MATHKTGTREEWLKARIELLKMMMTTLTGRD